MAQATRLARVFGVTVAPGAGKGPSWRMADVGSDRFTEVVGPALLAADRVIMRGDRGLFHDVEADEWLY
eukprot:7136404-Lingulodinium_polyedra.AAC.1